MSEYIINQIAAASVPDAPVGSFTLFLDTDGIWKKKDENGVVSAVSQAETQGLPDVLGLNNTTGANDIIIDQGQVVKNGKFSIDLNTGTDGNAELKNDKTSLKMLNNGNFNTTVGSFLSDTHFTQITQTITSFVFGLVKSTFSKIGQIQIAENDAGSVSSGTLPNYPTIITAQNSNVNSGVINSVISGGNGIIAKTNNTNYSTQIAYSKGKEAFELIVNHTTPTADRLQTHQDASGTIALLSDIPTELVFNVDLDSSESSVTRVFAAGRTTFTITHNLGTLDLKPEVFRLSDGRTIGWRIERTGINTIEASRNGNVADGLFRILI